MRFTNNEHELFDSYFTAQDDSDMDKIHKEIEQRGLLSEFGLWIYLNMK